MTARRRGVTRALSALLAAAVILLAVRPAYDATGGWSLGYVPAALAQASGWVATMTGAPTAPRSFYPAEWDVVVHSRDAGEWRAFEPMQAEHGADCGSPATTHTVSRYEDAVYQCRDHVMTAVNGPGYALAYLTPNQMVDFSTGEAVVKVDVSTFRNSARDYFDIWVTPYEDNLQLPLDAWLPDLGGEPRNTVHVRLDFGGNYFVGSIVRDGRLIDLPLNTDAGYDTVLTPSQSRRDTFELRISRNRVRFGLPAYNLWWIDAPVADLGWSKGVVQFGHHSYNPSKCEPGETCEPGTWHWDNFSISPAVPFTMLRGDQRWVDATTSPTVRFAAPAPAGSNVRFSGIGDALQASIDGGQTWAAVRRQPSIGEIRDELFKSYWMPIPAGTTRVDFRGEGFWGGPWMVRDVSIWSQTAVGGTAPPPGVTPPTAPPPTATPPPVTLPPVTPPTATPPPTVTPPPPANCTARPAFVVRAEPASPGVLRVTTSAGTTAGAPNNALRAVRFGQAQNASIEVAARGPVASGAALTMPAATRELTFLVRRTTAGAATTLPLTLVDDCGEWQTFVGGGPNAF